jgi:hypothetical protein
MVLDLHAYFQHIAEREDSGEEYPYSIDELVPTVFARRSNAIEALTKDNSGFSQVIDYRQIPVARHDATSVPGTRQVIEYRLTTACFEFLVARKSQPVFEIYRQVYHTLRKQTKAQPARLPP